MAARLTLAIAGGIRDREKTGPGYAQAAQGEAITTFRSMV